MSITVTNNADGSFTVACGAESMRVVPSTTNPMQGSGGAGRWRPVSAGGGGVTANLMQWPVVTQGGGGVTASLVGELGSRFSVDSRVVGSQAEIEHHLSDLVASHADSRLPDSDDKRVLRIVLASGEPLDVAPISQAWRSVLNRHYAFCEVHLPDLDD
jgi:hypothetical protein